MCERQRETERDRQRERERQTDRERERERERARETPTSPHSAEEQITIRFVCICVAHVHNVQFPQNTNCCVYLTVVHILTYLHFLPWFTLTFGLNILTADWLKSSHKPLLHVPASREQMEVGKAGYLNHRGQDKYHMHTIVQLCFDNEQIKADCIKSIFKTQNHMNLQCLTMFVFLKERALYI